MHRAMCSMAPQFHGRSRFVAITDATHIDTRNSLRCRIDSLPVQTETPVRNDRENINFLVVQSFAQRY